MFGSAPPRFVVRTTVASLVMVAGVLTAVFIGFTLNMRERVRGAVADKLEIGQRMLSALEQRRARELSVQVTTLAENPMLKAAVDTYQSEIPSANIEFRRDMLLTIEREVGKLALRIEPDVIAVTDATGTVLAVAGRRATDWPKQARVTPRVGATVSYVSLPTGVFHLATTPLALQDVEVGFLQLGRALDERYAQELSTLSGAATVIVSGDRVAASTLPDQLGKTVTPAIVRSLASTPILLLGRSEYAVKQLFPTDGDAAVYALDSISASTRVPMQDALRAVIVIAVGAFALAAFASVWLARTISRPIDRLSRSLSEMTASRSFDSSVKASGYTQEVDTLTATFNTMMSAVSAAEADTRSAYVGTIRALAMALDARDPYTSGHSERVSALSVAIGRQMQLTADQLEILRLGALLHDIGKIGISDAVLRKPGALTAEEFALIEQHPSVGARILRNVHFLAPHLPIVELHHERPDGQGYPHRLQGDEIPLPARIVHVADAFDAMTSARAYRPARGAAEALRELWRCAGSQFDAEVVQALAAALPSIDVNVIGDGRASSSISPARLAVVGTGGRA